ncbi:hypothetical protein [uncultured Bacteroides sp.]|uniref:hypothetical protein n=1 Tax=uncultured Bacteroides sp. TaxID=162156 RepID=UPI0025F920F4|nr:hypothetical protein [uncultured Bacteroides sp.]
MGDILTIKDKILTFLKEQDIRKIDFFEATGIQSSNFKGKNMASQPGGEMIVKILTLYPELSAEWLLRGEGNMIKTDNINIPTSTQFAHKSEIRGNEEKSAGQNIPPEMIDRFLSTITEQAEEIGMLKQKIAQLEKEKDNFVSGVSDSLTANAG